MAETMALWLNDPEKFELLTKIQHNQFSTLIKILLFYMTKLIQLNVFVDRLTVAQLKCRDVIRNGELRNFQSCVCLHPAVDLLVPSRSDLILNSTPPYQGLADKILTNAPHPELQREPKTKYEEEDNQLDSFNLLSCLNGFCLVVGSGGEVIFASDNIQKFVGLNAEEVLGQHLPDFVHPCDQVTFLHYLGVKQAFLKLSLAAQYLMIASAERMLDARTKF